MSAAEGPRPPVPKSPLPRPKPVQQQRASPERPAAPPAPSAAAPEPKKGQFAMARPKLNLHPHTPILAMMNLQQTPDKVSSTGPSAAQIVLKRIAIRNKVLHSDDTEAPSLKREGGDPLDAEIDELSGMLVPSRHGTPGAFAEHTETVSSVGIKRKRTRREQTRYELERIAQYPQDEVLIFMEGEIAAEAAATDTEPVPIYQEDVVEFRAALISASTLYSTVGGATSVMAKPPKPKPSVPKACTNCKRAHVSCDSTRPCERCRRLKKDDCRDIDPPGFHNSLVDLTGGDNENEDGNQAHEGAANGMEGPEESQDYMMPVPNNSLEA